MDPIALLTRMVEIPSLSGEESALAGFLVETMRGLGFQAHLDKAGNAGPAVSAGLDSVRLASATDSLASFLNAAVNRAERRQQPMELIISPKDNLLTLYSNEPGFTRELRLPEGIAIEAVLPQNPDDPQGARRLILMPGASVPGGKRRIVRLDPMTGFPRVESVDKE